MSNYISMNAKYYKAKDYQHIYKHDFRITPVTYKLQTSSYQNFSHEFSTFEDLHSKKAEIMKRKNTNLRENENSVLEFVVALSREETTKILSQKDGCEKLNNALRSTMENISKKYGFTSLFYAFHADEGYKNNDKNIHNFHAHLTFYNYNFAKEKSVLKYIKKDAWGKMQDLAAQCFQKVGLNYIRGEKKETKAKDHLERKLYISTKKEAIKDVQNYINNATKNILENSQEKSIFGDKLDQDLLQKNIKKEVLKALKFHIPNENEKTQKNEITSLHFELFEMQKDLTKIHGENEKLVKVIKQQQQVIEEFEKIFNEKQDYETQQKLNEIKQKNVIKSGNFEKTHTRG